MTAWGTVDIAVEAMRRGARDFIQKPWENCRLLADTLSVSRDAVTLVSGHGGRDKIVELTGIDPDRVERRLTAAARKEQP